ncbi:DUF3408 domain-containing protein [Bacteroides pyogenes]|uniref:DUF3408 domain-containing protein n=1 Tax=Bacteroides pyogenes TaxID=310300 RepID=UPI0011E488E0|nr:DUF3408 domain-containing protein [Bacteroides pyogenes]MBR8707037.1 hypothetical protein [Bacteroides pyogenes]TYK34273.1 DUF3408 domain-containing protein [Bacteroides pyogenes]
MTSITEERKKILRSKLKEMGNYGVQERSPEESPFYDQPTEIERDLERLQSDEPQETKEKEAVAESSAAEMAAEPLQAKKTKHKVLQNDVSSAQLSFEEYRERYLSHSLCSNGKSGFTINSEVLQLLRDVLRDVRAKTTLTAYIENILLDHLKENQAMLNKTAAQYKRNQTLNL